ncbi:hypothetical protein ACIQU5_15480 [Streptomyces sp. NPDC090306]|uniref:hypothetical protein n=1 Tax=Streptomyces sp. NPDC090306 TaxID=3365961 RepID=UPI003824EA80
MPATERDGTPFAATGVPLRDLLAAGAAARAVSTPPTHDERAASGDRADGAARAGERRAVAGARRGAAAQAPGETPGARREAA